MVDQPKKSKTVIEGVTESGQTFRPSDWAERVSGSLSSFRNRRIIYSPMLRPAVRNGNKCIIVDDSLKETNPELYEELIAFAKKNKLKMKKSDQ